MLNIKSKSKGFTLIELLVTVMIFGMIFMSLAVLWSNSYRYIFYSFRKHSVKNSVTTAMKALQNDLSVATRIDAPAAGSTGTQIKAVANMDKTSGCYPMQGTSASWVIYCLADDPNGGVSASGVTEKALFVYRGTLSCGSPCVVCGDAGALTWPTGGSYPSITCGTQNPSSGIDWDMVAGGFESSSFTINSQEPDRVIASFSVNKSSTPTSQAISFSAQSDFKLDMTAD